MEWKGENGEVWRWLFTDGKMIEKEGRIVWGDEGSTSTDNTKAKALAEQALTTMEALIKNL